MHFMNEKFYFSIRISMKFVSTGQIGNESALVQVMDWRQAIVWTSADSFHRGIYAVLGREKLVPLTYCWRLMISRHFFLFLVNEFNRNSDLITLLVNES